MLSFLVTCVYLLTSSTCNEGRGRDNSNRGGRRGRGSTREHSSDSSSSDSKTIIDSDFVCNKNVKNNYVKYLSNSDFKSGSVRIKSKGYYALNEDIIFDPNPNLDEPNNVCAWRPCNDPEYPGSFDDDEGGAFNLGFFAAIVVESDDVTIDLCGYTMVVSTEFYIQQRFFSHIELSSVPLTSDQGPLINDIRVITNNNLKVINGKFGLSPHHAIHGLNVSNVHIEDIEVTSYEVAAIQFNGFSHVTIKNVKIVSSSLTVFNSGFYSNARFLIKPLKVLMERIPNAKIKFSDRHYYLTVQDIFDELILQMDLFFKFMTNNLEDFNEDKIKLLDPWLYNSFKSSLKLFGNDLKVQDCGAHYGIILHNNGFAVKNFGDGISGESMNAYLENIIIKDLVLNTREVVGYEQTDNNLQAFGPFGELLDMLSVVYNISNVKDVSKFEYIGNVVSDAQIVIAKYGNNIIELAENTISDDIITWSEGTNTLKGFLRCNGDIMEHLNKGIIGLRIEETENVKAENIKISHLNNLGIFGSSVCGDYDSPDNGGHLKQFDGGKYGGTTTRGISIFSSQNIELKDIYLNNINSCNGDSIGIDIIGKENKNIKLYNIKIDNINAGINVNKPELRFLKYGQTVNSIPEACAVKHENSIKKEVKGLSHVKSSNINGVEIC